MATKRGKLKKTLPKDLEALMATAATNGDYAAVHAALEACEPDARGGYGNQTPLMMAACTPELARWLVARGTDINAANTWGRTALHASAAARFRHQLPVESLIELGADVHHWAKTGLTPLHSAADGKHVHAIEVLLRHGANVAALADGLTPLEYALQRMSNIDLVAMVPTAKTLLAAGATVTARAQDFVKKAAENFEFHRAGFKPDSVAETLAASHALCGLFGVEPPTARRMHDGSSPIVATAATWQKQHTELWNLLVPSQGACTTVQGEVIRIAGRVSDELHRNGGCNWDEQYERMLAAFCQHVASHQALPADQVAECQAMAEKLRGNHELARRLTELAVAWVGKNPRPMALTAVPYTR